MKVEDFINVLDCDFYTGVPDSQLKALCNYLMNVYGIDEKHHIIAANEGNCTALAAGYHLATGKVPLIYMQNSGEGNIINPTASLLNDKVYAIPAIFVIGWRGQPGIHDEPQHIYQGQITCDLLDLMDIENFTIDTDTTIEELENVMKEYEKLLKDGKQVAFVVKKGALSYDGEIKYQNDNDMVREEIIEHIVNVTGENPIISTTGKASRELFEIRERNNQSHKYDFLTVGSMGHTSSIALGVAINKPDEKVWCIDGDGSLLMHMGAMAVVGNFNPKNLVHVVINNEAHETVGGMPTAVNKTDLVEVAKACGYSYAVTVDNFKRLDEELNKVKSLDKLSFIEIKSSIGARDDLGRPTTTAIENKENFMEFLGN
ncbi:phosphonopyruvate decarboxylase [uncultured Methanobrevibacter sp.]|uniref:phosphonopyruvate decarboxylase n=1 Tax=uncultured Methanobrevibacter sp. TaxID=253161 RepID=UPI0025CC43ED|nr:phosphonopyruvate decarboxylase [uncultured Methanobrevibacter sp.]